MGEVRLVRPDEDRDAELTDSAGGSAVERRSLRPPQLTRLGRYRLVRELASGGMASVNLAVTEGLDKLVALKMIHPHLAQEEAFVQMFLDEARIASSISHRNVCNTFDFGEVDGRYFIAMDFLAGQSLRDMILRLRRMPEEASPAKLAVYMTYIMAEACEGLHAAHELRDPNGALLEVVHRDVSPHNLFITYDGNISVVDFGIARAADRIQHTATGVLKGKFSYMAPEQVRQLDVDRRADVWSLGVCLWEAITLERLFVRSSQADTLMSVMMDRIRPPSEVRPDIPKALDAIVMRALARSPAQRYATAREMGRDLMQVVRESAISVGPVELEQWIERLFAEERESSRSLLRQAKQAALESSWPGHAPLMRSATRSGLQPKVPAPSVSHPKPAPHAARKLTDSSDDVEIIVEAAPEEIGGSLPAKRRMFMAALVGLCAAIGATWGLEHWRNLEHLTMQVPSAPRVIENSPPQELGAVTSERLPAPPVARPAPVAQPAQAPEKLAIVRVDDLPETATAEPEARPSQRETPSHRTPNRVHQDRASASQRSAAQPDPNADASRSALANPSLEPNPDGAKAMAVEPEPKAPSVESVPIVPSPSTTPVQAPAPTVAANALREASSTPAPQAVKSGEKPAKPQILDARSAFVGLDVEGSLGSGVVSRMLARAEPLIHTCYVDAARRAGKNDFSSLTLSLTIDEMGAVRSVDASAHSLAGLSKCAADALKRLRSERKPDIGTVRVRFQLSFRAP
jgi:serine/threonine protein kinase